MNYLYRSIPETAYEAESELLRIAKQPARPAWYELMPAEQQMYCVMLSERFATPEREA